MSEGEVTRRATRTDRNTNQLKRERDRERLIEQRNEDGEKERRKDSKGRDIFLFG